MKYPLLSFSFPLAFSYRKLGPNQAPQLLGFRAKVGLSLLYLEAEVIAKEELNHAPAGARTLTNQYLS